MARLSAAQKNKRKRQKKPKEEDRVKGHDQVVEIELMVDNPYFDAEYIETGSNPSKILATVNMMESPALWMYSHRWIDTAQFQAATMVRKCYEAEQGGGIQSFDYTKEFVDGGKVSDGITDYRMRAGKKLKFAKLALDAQDKNLYPVVHTICAECLQFKSAFSTSWARRVAKKRLLLGLDILVEHWGLGHAVKGDNGQNKTVRKAI